MTDFDRKQLQLVQELTITLLTFDGSAQDINDHLTRVFSDPTLTKQDRELMPQIVLAAFGSGTFILQQLRHREGFESVDLFLQAAARQWAHGLAR
jgi:hypothetical protein